MILRAMITTQKTEYDIEDDYANAGRAREPLLNPQVSQTSGSSKGDGKGAYVEGWSSRIREKVYYFDIKCENLSIGTMGICLHIYIQLGCCFFLIYEK